MLSNLFHLAWWMRRVKELGRVRRPIRFNMYGDIYVRVGAFYLDLTSDHDLNAME